MKTHPVRAWRLSQGLTQLELAKKFGLSRWSLNRIEAYALNPSVHLAKRISKKTSIPVHLIRPDVWTKIQKGNENG